MKITNWRRKLAATLVAGGLISPAAAARAANLNTNLVTNGDFETVNLNVFGEYAGPLVLNWTGPNLYAYSHDGSTSAGSGTPDPDGDPQANFPAVVPDYADGPDPPGAGHWYFTPNNPGQIGLPTDPTFTDVHDPGAYYQDIDVSAGATSTAISIGKGRVDISAYMSSYNLDTDVAHVRVEYRDAGGVSQGFAQLDDSDPGPANVWNLNSGSGAIPVGTTTLRTSLFGTRTAGGGGADGYMDNVDVRVNQTTLPQFLVLEVNPTNGNATIKNETGAAVHINYYEITSSQNSLKTNWTGLQGQNLDGFPPGNGSGNGWEKGGTPSTSIISENFLTNSSTVTTVTPVPLGSVYNTASPAEIAFYYAAVPAQVLSADFEDDGDVDGANFLTWQRNFGTTTGATKLLGNADPNVNNDADVDGTDYAIWKNQFGDGTFSGPGVLVRGIVRFVPGTVTIPEPSSVILAGLGLAVIALRAFRDDNDC